MVCRSLTEAASFAQFEGGDDADGLGLADAFVAGEFLDAEAGEFREVVVAGGQHLSGEGHRRASSMPRA